MPILMKPISAMEKCFMDEDYASKAAVTAGTALRGEEFCFEVAYTSDEPGHHPKCTLALAVDSPLAAHVTVSTVEQVPIRMPCYSDADDNYLRKTPGLYPDLLVPVAEGAPIFVTYGELKSLFVTVKVPEDWAAGDYPVAIRFCSGADVIAEAVLTLHVLDAVLPKQDFIVTEWFHCDCIASYYDLDTFSEQHWQYIKNFMKAAVENGINAILMPVFTPPLDTAVGGERPTTQLVDVSRTADGWTFGFERVERWVRMALECGVEYFEISHLYTQWGAGHAPKVMGWKDGQYGRLFGWETDSLSEEYRGFLRAFLTEFIAKMKALGVDKKCLFHISDEPSLDHLEQYRAARAQISDLLDGYVVMDALSNFEFYKTGAIANPIPANNHIDPFLEAKVPNLWTYYCCGQGRTVSNRFVAMPMARTRVIGTQFWKYGIAGFLQWGYNFWYSQGSVRLVDPYQITDGDYFFPAGDGFAVYPGPHGQPYLTLHMKAFTMALSDMRAMYLAEEKCGREAVLRALEEDLGPEYARGITFSQYPSDAGWLEGVRARVNGLIEG
ncbi:MAG: glycoside hydrolase domain-containing protein [Eubacteriales bacterium]